MDEQQDLFAAKHERDKALVQVEKNAESYPDQAMKVVVKMVGIMTGEDIRLHVERQIGSPHHHNAWGAIINKALRSGLIHKTGRYVSMKTPKSHARATPEYRRHQL